jgi:hypothetical protein
VTGTSPVSEVVGDTPLGALRAADTYDSLLSRTDYAVILAMPLHHFTTLDVALSACPVSTSLSAESNTGSERL